MPDACRQLVAAVAADWDSPRASLLRFERDGPGAPWRAVAPPAPAQLGRSGLAWGRGVRGQDEPGAAKREGDGRAPAGLFAIGLLYTNDPAPPEGTVYPFFHVTEADAWIDDPDLPDYNRRVRVDLADPPAWFARQRMNTTDPVYRWRIEIRHNADPPAPGAGSAIFFHLRRGPDRRTAGCTTLAEADLLALIRWLRAEAAPHYVLLPREAYAARAEAWGLPSLAEFTSGP